VITQAGMMRDKPARLLCAWCLAEGKSIEESTIRRTTTYDGRPSHGICKRHFDIEMAKMDAEDAKKGKLMQ